VHLTNVQGGAADPSYKETFCVGREGTTMPTIPGGADDE
jgi:hypothetical protein